MKSVFGRLAGGIRESFNKLLHINASPHQIAIGFSLGAFIGVFPTFGLGGVIAMGICALFGFNYVSTAIGAIIIMNPLTSPFFWALSAMAGAYAFGKEPSVIMESLKGKGLADAVGEIAVIYLAGNLIVSAVVSVICYFVIKQVIVKYRSQKNADA